MPMADLGTSLNHHCAGPIEVNENLALDFNGARISWGYLLVFYCGGEKQGNFICYPPIYLPHYHHPWAAKSWAPWVLLLARVLHLSQLEVMRAYTERNAGHLPFSPRRARYAASVALLLIPVVASGSFSLTTFPRFRFCLLILKFPA